MDAGELSNFVTVFLPFLVQSGRRFGEEAADELGTRAWELAKRIWGRLRPGVEARPAALEAAQDVADRPDDQRARGALELQLEKVLSADPAVAADIAALWKEAKAAGVVAAGERSVAIRGNVTSSIITTGEHTTIEA